MAITTEILKILGWVFILGQSVAFKKYLTTDVFWLNVMSAALMLIAASKGFSEIGTKTLWGFLADSFIIFVFIYKTFKKVRKEKQLQKFKDRTYSDLKYLKSNEKTRNNS